MKKILVVIGILLAVICVKADINVQASTSSALDEVQSVYYNYQKYADNYNAPYSKNQDNNISINETTGGLSIRETDISLPGKNGMDVNITRIYSNQDSGYDLAYKSNNNITSTYYGYLYKSGSVYIMVYFDEEEYADGVPDSFESSIVIPGYTYSEINFDIDSALTGYKISYDMLKRMDYTGNVSTYVKYSDNVYEETVTSPYFLQDMDELSIGNGFRLAWPRLVVKGFGGRYGESGVFENENGEIYTFESSDYKNDTEYTRYVSIAGSSDIILRYKVERYLEELTYKDIYYTAVVTDIDGKKYYFYQPSDSQTAQICLIEDVHGNTIYYSYDDNGDITITDTYGRNIKVSRQNLSVISGNDYGDEYTNLETRVTIENGTAKQEVIYKTSVDSNNNNKIYDDKYIFEVRKKEIYNNATADNSEYVTRYEMSRKQTTLHKCKSDYNIYTVVDSITKNSVPYLSIRGKDIYNIDKIVYPTGAYSTFSYSDDIKLYEKEDFRYFTNAFKVLSSKDVLSDGTIKNAYTYTYNSQADFSSFGVYVNTENTTTITDGMGTVKTINYSGHSSGYKTRFNTQTKDSSGQIIDDRIYYQIISGVKESEEINSYNMDNTEYTTNYIYETYLTDIANLFCREKNGNYDVEYGYALTTPDTEVATGTINGYIGLRGIAGQTPETITYKKDADTTIKIESVYGTKDGVELEKYIRHGIDENITQEYYTERNLYLVRTSIYENDVEKARVQYQYDSSGNVIKETTKINETDEEIVRTYGYEYGTNGELTVTSSVLNTENILLNGEEPEGTKYSITTVQKYDTFGNLIYQKDGNGSEWTYSYDMLGRIKKITDPMGNSTIYDYNLEYNEVWVYDAEGNNQVYAYDELGYLETVYSEDEINGVYNLASFEYDSLYRMIKEIEYLDRNSYNSAVYTYDAKNRVTSTMLTGTEETGKGYNEYTYEYNDYDPNAEDSNVGSVTITPSDTNYAVTELYYEINTGNLLREKALSRTNTLLYGSEYSYDYIGNMLNVKEGNDYGTANYTLQTTYDYSGNVLTQKNAAGQELYNNYDMAGRLISSTNYAGDTTSYVYNTLGQLIEQSSPFDDDTNVLSRIYYDRNGNVVRTENQTGIVSAASKSYNIIKNVYNADNTLKKVIACDGDETQETSYEYYKNGLLKSQSVGSNSGIPEITTYEYNGLNQLVKTTDPLGQSVVINPNYTGNPISVTDKNGTVTEYKYNALGSVLSVNAQNSKNEEKVLYTYDSLGNVKTMNDSTGSTCYTYDELGRLNTEDKNNASKTYDYDMGGNLSQITVKYNGTNIQYTEFEYDNLDRLINVSDKVNTAMKASYTYTVNGQLASETRGNNNVTATYTYNKAGLLTELTEGGDTYEYSYYADGNINSVSKNNVQEYIYFYNGLGQLTAEWGPGNEMASYKYDEYGNRIEKIYVGDKVYSETYTYDLNNRLLTETWASKADRKVTNYTYDPNGNQLYKVSGEYGTASGDEELNISSSTDSGTYYEKYEYNLFNKLTKVVKNGILSTYTYDGNGQRQSKTVDGETTNHMWVGSNIVAETDESGEVISNYYYGLSLYGMQNSGTNAYYVYNGHGDVTKLIGGNGTVVASYNYDSFGNETESTESIYNPFHYNGQYTDEETGLIYLRNRYYDPSIGRFTQEDPIKDGFNWYVYCGNNPVNFVDPWGLYLEVNEDAYKNLNYIAREIFGKGEEFNLNYKVDGDNFILDIETWEYDDIEAVSELGKALLKNLICYDSNITVTFEDGELSKSTADIIENNLVITMRGVEFEGATEGQIAEYVSAFIHEGAHIYSYIYEINSDLNNYAASRNYGNVSASIKHSEAIAITVEEKFREEMNYTKRDSSFGKIGNENDYAAWIYNIPCTVLWDSSYYTFKYAPNTLKYTVFIWYDIIERSKNIK